MAQLKVMNLNVQKTFGFYTYRKSGIKMYLNLFKMGQIAVLNSSLEFIWTKMTCLDVKAG